MIDRKKAVLILISSEREFNEKYTLATQVFYINK